MRIKFLILSWLLIFCFMDLFSQISSQEYWWQVEMVIDVKGNYKYGNKINGFKGDFSFKIYLSEGMERDNGDYIIYPGKPKILELKWKEIYYKVKKKINELDLSEKINPEFILNYVLRNEGKISFDLEIAPVSVPHEGFYEKRRLLLPRSEQNQNIHMEDKYNICVKKGSHRVVMDDASIYKKNKVAGVFKWNWKKKGFLWYSFHSVELRVNISRSKK